MTYLSFAPFNPFAAATATSKRNRLCKGGLIQPLPKRIKKCCWNMRKQLRLQRQGMLIQIQTYHPNTFPWVVREPMAVWSKHTAEAKTLHSKIFARICFSDDWPRMYGKRSHFFDWSRMYVINGKVQNNLRTTIFQVGVLFGIEWNETILKFLIYQ